MKKNIEHTPTPCPHEDKQTQTHWFKFKPFTGRNIWNPFEPSCEKCGITIGQIFNSHDKLVKDKEALLEVAKEMLIELAGYVIRSEFSKWKKPSPNPKGRCNHER